MNGPQHFADGERILADAEREDAPEWVIARSQLAAAHFTAALAAAALNENLAKALLTLDAAVAWQRSQDPAPHTPTDATAKAIKDRAELLEPHRGHRLELRSQDRTVLARGVLDAVTAQHATVEKLEAGRALVPLAEIAGVVRLQARADQPATERTADLQTHDQ
ncbi:hypothetical protein ABT299_11720 [Spirillospora sp. NPDC000708]